MQVTHHNSHAAHLHAAQKVPKLAATAAQVEHVESHVARKASTASTTSAYASPFARARPSTQLQEDATRVSVSTAVPPTMAPLLEEKKPPAVDAQPISEQLVALRAQMHAAGVRCAIDLGSMFCARAAAGKDLMDYASAAHSLRSQRLRISDAQCSTLFAPYTEGGRVRMGLLVRDLIGGLNENRAKHVNAIFERLDGNHDGLVLPSDIRRVLRIAHHPLVVTGQATLDQVHTGFLARATDIKNEPLTHEQFETYHASLSTAFRRDDEFAAWLQKFWRW